LFVLSQIITGHAGFRIENGELAVNGFAEFPAPKTPANNAVVVNVLKFSNKVDRTEDMLNIAQQYRESPPEIKDKICSTVQSLLEKTGRVYAQNSRAWLATRSRMVTASDAAACFDKNDEEFYAAAHHPFKSSSKLLKEKLRPTKTKPNQAMNYGKAQEPRALQLFASTYGVDVLMSRETKKDTHHVQGLDFGCRVHKKYDFIGGSADGITASGDLIEVCDEL
jgi:hypothetical protein